MRSPADTAFFFFFFSTLHAKFARVFIQSGHGDASRECKTRMSMLQLCSSRRHFRRKYWILKKFCWRKILNSSNQNLYGVYFRTNTKVRHFQKRRKSKMSVNVNRGSARTAGITQFFWQFFLASNKSAVYVCRVWDIGEKKIWCGISCNFQFYETYEIKFHLATLCTNFPLLTYYSTSLVITLRFQDISLFLDVAFFRFQILLFFFLSFDLLLFCVYTVLFQETPSIRFSFTCWGILQIITKYKQMKNSSFTVQYFRWRYIDQRKYAMFLKAGPPPPPWGYISHLWS